MTDKKTLKVQAREIEGRKVKKLKKDGLVAGNIYGSDIESLKVQINKMEVSRLWEEMGETQILYVNVEGEKLDRPVLFDEVQVHPLTREVRHVSLRQVNLKEKIEAEVEIVLTGEASVPETVVIQTHNQVSVEALPTDLPEQFVIDVSELKAVDQSVTFSDLKYDKSKVRLLIEEEEMNDPVVILQALRVETDDEQGVENEAGEAVVAA